MRPDHASRAGADHAQQELHISDGSGVGASVADRCRLLSPIQLEADDVEHHDQPERNQDRDVPMWPTLSWPSGASAVEAGPRAVAIASIAETAEEEHLPTVAAGAATRRTESTSP